jgi:hypothetical protein
VTEATKEYWETLEEFLTRYAILAHSPPKTEADMHRVYALLRSAHGINVDDLITYVDQFAASASNEIQPDAVKYDQNLAGEGDAYGQLRMGERYEDGEGVQRDESRARDLFARAAAQGDMVAALAWEKLFAFIPANMITVNASSVFSPDQIARHLVDGSGMVGAVHDNNYAADSMWQSIERPMPGSPVPGLAPSPAWVRFDFSQPQKFDSILIWNHNQVKLTDRGFRETRIYGSSDGVTWFPLTQPQTIELPRADGGAFAVPVSIANIAADRPIKSVIIAAEATNGNYGSKCFGLSAVRFVLDKLGPALPANLITVTASSVYSPDQVARHLVDGSGMQGSIHDNNSAAQTMWQSSENPAVTSPAQGLAPSPAWIRFDFAQPREFDAMLIWNHNQESLTDRGFRKTRIYGSSEGLVWFPLTSPELIELPRADGTAFGEAATITNAAAGRPIKSVIIAADDMDGNYGSTFYGLSAVRFVAGH